MERPIINFIEDQKTEETTPNVSSWEAEQLLRKYGFDKQYSSQPIQPIPTQEPGLTFEEMLHQEDVKRKEEEMRRKQRLEDNRRDHNEVRFSSDEDTGFTFKVEIYSDMKLPRY